MESQDCWLPHATTINNKERLIRLFIFKAGPQLGEQKGAAPPKQKFRHPKLPNKPTQTPFILAAVQRTRRKVDQFGAMTFFLEINWKVGKN